MGVGGSSHDSLLHPVCVCFACVAFRAWLCSVLSGVMRRLYCTAESTRPAQHDPSGFCVPVSLTEGLTGRSVWCNLTEQSTLELAKVAARHGEAASVWLSCAGLFLLCLFLCLSALQWTCRSVDVGFFSSHWWSDDCSPFESAGVGCAACTHLCQGLCLQCSQWSESSGDGTRGQ